jgi:hypothetical protein
MISARIAELKKKASTPCASTSLRIGREVMFTSEVWKATAMAKDRCRKSV